MLEHFRRFDTALIERVFQPAADSLASRAGLRRLSLVWLCLDAASVAWILSQAGSLSAAVLQWQATAGLFRAALLLAGLAALRGLRVLFQRVNVGRINPLRVLMLPHRGIILALLLARAPAMGNFAGAADAIMLILAACALYLGACMPPASVRRRRDWIATSGAS